MDKTQHSYYSTYTLSCTGGISGKTPEGMGNGRGCWQCMPTGYTVPWSESCNRRNTVMKALRKQQQGASGFAIIIILALLGVGVYVGLQYIPQFIEAGNVDSILDSIESTHKEAPFKSTSAVQNAIGRQLSINRLEDLGNSFKVTENENAFVINVQYERELNLIYEQKKMPYDKSLNLKR